MFVNMDMRKTVLIARENTGSEFSAANFMRYKSFFVKS